MLALLISVGGAFAASFLPVAGVLGVAVPAASLGASGLLLLRRQWIAHLELVLWLWLLTPFVRRVIDEAGSFSEQSTVLLAAPLASLLALFPALARPSRLHRDASSLFLVALTGFAYAFAVGAVRFGVVPAGVGLVPWLAPLAVGLHVATMDVPMDELRQAVIRISTFGALVLGAYGTYQYFLLPSWDANWMMNVPLVSIGRPEPLEVRVFSTLNAPAPFAMVLGALLVVTTASPSRWRLPASLIGFVAFGLSLVRTAWFGLAVALVALLATGRSRAVRTALVIVVVPLVLLVTVGGPATETVTSRFDATVEAGDEDKSLSDRVASYTTNIPPALADLGGEGYGRVGAAGRELDEEEQGGAVTGYDSAVIEGLLTMGSVVGVTFFLLAISSVVMGWQRARRSGDLERGMGAALVALLAQAPLANIFVSVAGVAFWLLIGYLARPPAPAKL